MIRPTTSASNLHRRLRCPGSEEAEAGLPEETSAASDEGTALHAAFAAAALFDNFEPNLPQHEHRDLVLTARHSAREAIQRTEAAFAIDPREPFSEGYEREMWLRKGFTNVMPGHCDYWRYYPALRLLVIVDAKFGFLLVDRAPLNIQLRAYAVMGAQTWDVADCVVAIAQPRAIFHEGGERLTIGRYTAGDIAFARQTILDGLAAVKSGAPRIPSPDACRYCKARLLCPERLARLPDGSVRDVLPSLAAMPEHDFARLYAAVMAATDESTVKKLKDEARFRLQEGRMPGYQLQENSPRRTIVDGGRAYELLLAANIAKAAAQSCISIGVGKVETALRTTYKYKAAEAKEEASKLLAPVIALTDVAPSIIEADPEEETARKI